jgi:hypothetical protein
MFVLSRKGQKRIDERQLTMIVSTAGISDARSDSYRRYDPENF